MNQKQVINVSRDHNNSKYWDFTYEIGDVEISGYIKISGRGKNVTYEVLLDKLDDPKSEKCFDEKWEDIKGLVIQKMEH